MVTYLDEIIAAHRRRAAADQRDEAWLLSELKDGETHRPARDFSGALSGSGLAVIAEIKRRSPSKGPLAEEIDSSEVASAYEVGGACALSVLTDRAHFGGSPSDLIAARAAVSLPVLRKDFTVDRRDVIDARIMGADAVLLIAAVLSDEETVSFHSLATELGMAALVEIHDEAELERALGVGAGLIGVNQRDLRTFKVDTDRAVAMGSSIPRDVIAVAESGVRNAEDAIRLADAGYDAILVGESVVTSSDWSSAVAGLSGHPVAPNRNR